jgi:predicted nucleotidyltransferase
MVGSLQAYRESREALLAKIVQTLSSDDRFLAAWLTGSYARNEADAVSDIDLSVVVSKDHSQILCARHEQTSAQTSQERLELFSRFGQPAAIHENNNNAPEGGTFTFVLYHPSALVVDWTLIPYKQARRPFQSYILFDKVDLPVSPPLQPEDLDLRIKLASERIAFFWMMAAVTAKYIFRQDDVFVNYWLEELHKIVREVERLVGGQAKHHRRVSINSFIPTWEGQVQALYRHCDRMLNLMPKVADLGGYVPANPMPTIEILLNLRNFR